MKREQFLSRLRRYCRKKGLALRVDEERGKGSHTTVYVGERLTILKSGDLSPLEVRTILKQLDLPPGAL